MSYDEKSIRNSQSGITLSGLDPWKIDACVKCDFDIYFDLWSKHAYDALRDSLSRKHITKLVQCMDQFTSVSDFIASESEQRKEIAAYLLILLDRFAINAGEGFDPWVGFDLLHQIYECFNYITPSITALRTNARKAAAARHSENRSMKQEMLIWYEEHGQNLSNDDAAIAIKKQVPIKLRTAQDWVTLFRKQLRSARKT